jgi:hypothetical protein
VIGMSVNFIYTGIKHEHQIGIQNTKSFIFKSCSPCTLLACDRLKALSECSHSALNHNAFMCGESGVIVKLSGQRNRCGKAMRPVDIQQSVWTEESGGRSSYGYLSHDNHT